jgi:hypothetical protein
MKENFTKKRKKLDDEKKGELSLLPQENSYVTVNGKLDNFV